MVYKSKSVFTPDIPVGSQVAVKLLYSDGKCKILNMPVTEDMLCKAYGIGWTISLFQLAKYIPAGVIRYAVLN